MSKSKTPASRSKKATPKKQTQASPPNTSKASLILVLRGVVAFVLLGLLILVLYRWGYDSYKDVAEWAEPGSHNALIYNDETYYLSGQIGKKGLSKSKYATDKILGQVKDDGIPETTEAETTAEPESEMEYFPEDPDDWEETESKPESVALPVGGELFASKEHTYILYSVKQNEGYLILLEQDGQYYLYYREDKPNPLG